MSATSSCSSWSLRPGLISCCPSQSFMLSFPVALPRAAAAPLPSITRLHLTHVRARRSISGQRLRDGGNKISTFWQENCGSVTSFGRHYQSSSQLASPSSSIMIARARMMPSNGNNNSRKNCWSIICFPDFQAIVRDETPRKRMTYSLAFLLFLTSVAWVRNLGAAGLVDDTEPLFVEAARQMILTGDYVTPQFNALPRFDKPVLIYWLMAISVKIFGNQVWAYRLPSALCAFGLLSGLFLTVNQFGLHLVPPGTLEAQAGNSKPSSAGERFLLPALITSSAFALNLEVVAWGSAALSDMLLTSTMGASLLSFFWGYAGRDHKPAKHRWGYLLSAFFIGLAILSKGPIGIVYPACICTCFLLCTKELRQVLMGELPKVRGVILLALINLPWYGTMAAKHGSMFLSTFFGYHNVERYVKGVNHHWGRPWWYGLAVVLIMYFPWSLSLPWALIEANPWKHRGSCTAHPRSARLSLFAAFWMVIGYAIFALSSSQLPSYYLPVAPAVALLAAADLSLPASRCGKRKRIVTKSISVICYAALAGTVVLLPGLLASSGSAVVLEIATQMDKSHLHEIGFGILVAGGVLAALKIEECISEHCDREGESRVDPRPHPKKFRLPIWLRHTAAMFALTSSFVTPCLKLVDNVRQLPVRELATKATKLQQPGEPLVMVGERMPSVVFYSRLPTAFFDTSVEAANVLIESASNIHSALVITRDSWEGALQPAIIARVQSFSLLRVVVRKTGVQVEASKDHMDGRSSAI